MRNGRQLLLAQEAKKYRCAAMITTRPRAHSLLGKVGEPMALKINLCMTVNMSGHTAPHSHISIFTSLEAV
jgi:hypothetical protein